VGRRNQDVRHGVGRWRWHWATLAAVLLGGCAPQAATEQGRAIYSVYNLFMVAAAIVFVVVAGLVVWSVLRYRDDGSPGEPRQTHGHNVIELLWTVIPLLIVCVLLVFSFRAQDKVNLQSANPPVTVRVTGFQWQWRFDYQGADVHVIGVRGRPAEMVIPVGQPVHIRLTSADVQHSFYVPKFLYKRDAIPGRINDFDLTVKQAGTYQGVCAFICGLAHSEMAFRVRAVPPDEFARWLREASAPAAGG